MLSACFGDDYEQKSTLGSWQHGVRRPVESKSRRRRAMIKGVRKRTGNRVRKRTGNVSAKERAISIFTVELFFLIPRSIADSIARPFCDRIGHPIARSFANTLCQGAYKGGDGQWRLVLGTLKKGRASGK